MELRKRTTVKIGQKYSKLTVVEYLGLDSRNQRLWKCQCDCGNTKVVTTRALTSKHTRSCGCLYPKAENLTGRRFGKLVVVREVEPIRDSKGRKYHCWECKCDCGNTTFVTTQNLKGKTTSCGCYLKEVAGQQTLKHGYGNTRLYRIYNTMKQRCNNPKNSNYKNYGGRGIKVCDEWNSPDALPIFVKWALENGYKEGLTLDRKNVNGNYEPSNCRWATYEQQANNKRNNVYIEFQNELYTISQFSKKYHLDHRFVGKMVKQGFTADEILVRGKKI